MKSLKSLKKERRSALNFSPFFMEDDVSLFINEFDDDEIADEDVVETEDSEE